MEFFGNFFKKDVFSGIFIQAGISELKSIYYSIPFIISELIINHKNDISDLFIRYSKLAIFTDTIQTNIMGFSSLFGAFASQFNFEKK